MKGRWTIYSRPPIEAVAMRRYEEDILKDKVAKQTDLKLVSALSPCHLEPRCQRP